MKGAGAHCAPLREKGHAGGKGGSGTRPYGAVELRFVGHDDPACPSWGGRPQGSPLRRMAGGDRAPPLRPPMVRIPCRGAPLCAPAGSGNRYGPDKITPPGGIGPLTVQRAAGDAGPYGRGGGRRARTARPTLYNKTRGGVPKNGDPAALAEKREEREESGVICPAGGPSPWRRRWPRRRRRCPRRSRHHSPAPWPEHG